MDLTYSDEDERFRKELRAWLEVEVPRHGAPPPPGDWLARRAYDTAWQRKLHDAGYAGLHWPAAFGGRGLPVSQQLVYLEEYARANAPYISVNFVGMMHAGPTLIAEGTDEQRSFHLPRILRGDSVWCQGFSEPGAGSDLASLRTRAECHGDEYVVNGQKIWSTRAHVADYCELLVRTDPDAPKHKGITWLILDMHQPGVDVRPMRTIDGESHFCEVFLDDARVPVANRVGAENDGWRVTNVTLRFERGTAFAQHIITLRSQIRALVRARARRARRVGRRRAAHARRPAAGRRRRALAHDPDGHCRGRAHGDARANGLGGEAPVQRARAGDRGRHLAHDRTRRAWPASRARRAKPRATTSGRSSTRSLRGRRRSSAT